MQEAVLWDTEALEVEVLRAVVVGAGQQVTRVEYIQETAGGVLV